MGKTRGHGSRRGAYKGAGRSKGRGEEEGSESEEEYEKPRGLTGQAATAGMLPPSDSEDEDAEPGAAAADKKEAPEGAAKPGAGGGGQPQTAGALPPSGSEDEDEDGSDDDSSGPEPEYLKQPAAPRRKKDDEPDPEQVRKDIERLELIKRRREEDRLKRIKDEGWDRFAPISDTNKPPGHVPGDHPGAQE